MFNIQKAVGRLEFAPKPDQIKITDIKQGLGQFTPKPDKNISFAALQAALKKAGYELASAELTAVGTLVREDNQWWLVVEPSRQRFALNGANPGDVLKGMTEGSRVELAGTWRTEVKGAATVEVITPRTARLPTAGLNLHPSHRRLLMSVEPSGAVGSVITPAFLAPIRTASPGLTVYKGGAVVPRYSYSRQSAGNVRAERQALLLAFSYTPTPTVQLEAELPVERVSFRAGRAGRDRSQSMVGNLTVWTKHRFYRTVEEWGDKQAAVRVGLELPTGQKRAPSVQEIAAPAFVRQQLSAVNGGFGTLGDVIYSQARGRFIFGADLGGALRTERAGFRVGHEVRLSTDLEYVLLPVHYRSPGRELFAILESSLIHRGRGRLDGGVVPGSGSTAFSLAPGLQFTATPRFVVEASYQFPVARNSGPLALRTDRNLLVGIRLLY